MVSILHTDFIWPCSEISTATVHVGILWTFSCLVAELLEKQTGWASAYEQQRPKHEYLFKQTRWSSTKNSKINDISYYDFLIFFNKMAFRAQQISYWYASTSSFPFLSLFCSTSIHKKNHGAIQIWLKKCGSRQICQERLSYYLKSEFFLFINVLNFYFSIYKGHFLIINEHAYFFVYASKAKPIWIPWKSRAYVCSENSKVVGKEKWGRSGSWQMFENGFRPWQLMSVFIYFDIIFNTIYFRVSLVKKDY